MNKASIDTEEYRVYHYPDGSTYRVDKPAELYWKRDENGDSHRIVDITGVTHYPKRGWIAISWYAPDAPVTF